MEILRANKYLAVQYRKMMGTDCVYVPGNVINLTTVCDSLERSMSHLLVCHWSIWWVNESKTGWKQCYLRCNKILWFGFSNQNTCMFVPEIDFSLAKTEHIIPLFNLFLCVTLTPFQHPFVVFAKYIHVYMHIYI